MAIPVYDYRTDVRNVLVTPQIRSRFLRMEPGQVAALHSHDLGHEVFLVLAGRAAFEVEGETVELGPGQMCAVLAHQAHSVRVVGDEPMTMYLSVTPHVQPTHTGRTPDGGRLPLRFMQSSAYHIERDASVSLHELLDRQVAAARSLAEAARAGAQVQQETADRLRHIADAGEIAEGGTAERSEVVLVRCPREIAAGEAREAMWQAIYETYQRLNELALVWNELAPRVDEIREEIAKGGTAER